MFTQVVLLPLLKVKFLKVKLPHKVKAVKMKGRGTDGARGRHEPLRELAFWELCFDSDRELDADERNS